MNSQIVQNGHGSPSLAGQQEKLRQQQNSQHLQLVNGLSSANETITLSDAKYSLAGQHVMQPHEIYIKTEPLDPMPPLASPANLVDANGNVSSASDQQLYFISSELIQSSIKNPQPMDTDSPKHGQQQQVDQDHDMSTQHQSPLNGHSSPHEHEKQRQQQQHQQLNGGHEQAIVQLDAKEYALNNAVLQPHEIYIKTEPLDPMPPLASPATGVEVVAAGAVPVSTNDKCRDMEGSPPATVISLAPAQPYPRGAQLTFATPAYDISSNGQYTVVSIDGERMFETLCGGTNVGESRLHVCLPVADKVWVVVCLWVYLVQDQTTSRCLLIGFLNFRSLSSTRISSADAKQSLSILCLPWRLDSPT